MPRSRPPTSALVAALGAITLAGCGAARRPSPAIVALYREARPIGTGSRFHGRVHGPVLGACRSTIGPRIGAHVEVFAENRVVLLPAGIGVHGPRRLRAGRIASARCYGRVITVDSTGTAWVRPGRPVTLGQLFDSWGVTLGRGRLDGFAAAPGSRTRVFVDGRPSSVDPRHVVLSVHAEIVLEVGPYVPPHRSYAFPPGPS